MSPEAIDQLDLRLDDVGRLSDQLESIPHAKGFIVWRDSWTLNVDFMDEDHRCLVALLNHIALDLCLCAGGGWNWAVGTRLMSRLEAFGAHAREHFRREEQAMRETDFPGFAEHKAEHDLLLAEYTVMLRDIRSAGLRSLESSTLEALKQWFIAHIVGDDRDLADYLRHELEVGAIDGLTRRRLVVPGWSETLPSDAGGKEVAESARWQAW